jgi:hypothetical protein
MRPTTGRTRLTRESRLGHDHHDPVSSSRRAAFPPRPVPALHLGPGPRRGGSSSVQCGPPTGRCCLPLPVWPGSGRCSPPPTPATAAPPCGGPPRVRPSCLQPERVLRCPICHRRTRVVVITSEYATGSIRSTLTAAPQRVRVLAGQGRRLRRGRRRDRDRVVLCRVLPRGRPSWPGKGIGTPSAGRGALRSVIGAGLYLAVLGLLALGLGTLIRRTAGAIAAVADLIIILPVLVQGLPSSWSAAITRYLPSVADRLSSAGPNLPHLASCCLHGRASRCSAPTLPRS